MFRQDITCPALLDFTSSSLSCTGLSPCIAGLSRPFPLALLRLKGCSPFASPLLRESQLISFPPGT